MNSSPHLGRRAARGDPGAHRGSLRAFNLMQERPYRVSISAGVVLVDATANQPLSHYVLLADAQMYAQKRGRLR
jgi:GGDEF domain-containing protein